HGLATANLKTVCKIKTSPSSLNCPRCVNRYPPSTITIVYDSIENIYRFLTVACFYVPLICTLSHVTDTPSTYSEQITLILLQTYDFLGLFPLCTAATTNFVFYDNWCDPK
ncbi:MAG: hypothetical protein KDE53_36075, partial [Caldilineaceae bacterium]|nr:hypothetical protein [Caldilineaceae bacterium]